MRNWFKYNASHLTVNAVFLILIFVYFSPLWQGRALSQHDVVQAVGSQKEIFDYKAKDGHAPQWTNAMFGGMPVYQIWYEHAANVTTYLNRAIRMLLPLPADVILIYLLGSYFLLVTLRIRPWLAALGAIAITFSSYNFIYLEAGHVNKAYAIAYMAPTIGAVILCFKGKRLYGAVLLALFLSLEIRANHLQMTYYLFVVMLLLVGFELYYALLDNKRADFIKSCAVQLGAIILAVAVNASVLFPTYEYSKLTTRGKANITPTAAAQKSNGLDKDYAYTWSQGISENLTFLIPNAYGGKSNGVLEEDSHIYKFFVAIGFPPYQAFQLAQNAPTYWGDKPITSGPWYFGAGIIALFILGVFIVNDRLKWWILSATALSIMLALGSNFRLLSDIFFDYFPMYNKFRAPESILIIPSILIPLFAVMAIQELIYRSHLISRLDKKILYSFGSVAGLCGLIALMPTILPLGASNQQELLAQLTKNFGSQLTANQYLSALLKDRAALASADAFRSFVIVLLVLVLIWSFLKKRIAANVFIILLGLVTLMDLWSVDKRYLNNEAFVDKHITKRPIVERQVDTEIRQDTNLSYRVLDLTTNPFADTKASFFHKSFGGYHAAKLMRFQELLEHQFNGVLNEHVLDMFNVRYVIAKDLNINAEQVQPRLNAVGNAWFVEKITFVEDNAQEMQAITSFDPLREAIIHEEFKSDIDIARLRNSDSAVINLLSYHPDTLKYEYSAPSDALAVFSEVYYEKGWKAYLDGQEVPYIRANYILRALQLPRGKHKVEFIFAPATMNICNTISLIGSIILVLAICTLLFLKQRKITV